MITHRRVLRPLATVALTAGLVLGGAALSPALADTPDTWEQAPDTSVLGFLLVLFIIPLGLAAVIALLTVLPSMAHDRGYQPGQAWRGDTEWFGGPTKGVGAADALSPQEIEARSKGTGGTSGGW